QNPCPCGFYGDNKQECICLPGQISNYQKKLSGPLKDRFDLLVNVPRIDAEAVINTSNDSALTTANARKIISTARNKQALRTSTGLLNSRLSNKQAHKFSGINRNSKDLLVKAADKLLLSPRGIIRCLRVARTIADIE